MPVNASSTKGGGAVFGGEFDRRIRASVTINENADTGRISVMVVSKQNADEVYVVGDGEIEVDGVGDSVAVSGVDKLKIIGVKDGRRQLLQTYRPRSVDTRGRFQLESDTSMTVQKAKERYVEGETWLLELENELEMALEE